MLILTSDNPLSVSHIVDNSGLGVCTFYGVDGSVTTVSDDDTVDVGPPQTQVSGTCNLYDSIHKRQDTKVTVTFFAAATSYTLILTTYCVINTSKFTRHCASAEGSCSCLNIAMDLTETDITTDNTLSVSSILVNGNADCNFIGIDGANVFVAGDTLVDVPQPQTIVSGSCIAV